MAGGYIGGGEWVSPPAFIVPLTALTTDPRFAPEANEGRIVQCDDGNRYHSDGIDWRLNLTGGVVDGVTVIRDTELFLEEFAETDLPTAALNDRRMVINGDNNLPVISDGSEWRSLVDEARAAEIAEDVAADVQRILSTSVTVTVGAAGDFATLGAALSHLSQFVPQVGAGYPLATVRILTGTTLAEQIDVFGVDMSWARIIADDAVVPVNVSDFEDNDGLGRAAFLRWQGCSAAEIACYFEAVGSPGAGVFPHGLIINDGTVKIVFADGDPAVLKRGLGGFHTNARLIGGFFNLDRAWLGGATNTGLLVAAGVAFCNGTQATGAGVNSAVIHEGGTLYIAGFGSYDADFKRGVSESSTDIAVARGGVVVKRVAGAGGYSIPANSAQPQGIVFDTTVAFPPLAALPSFTVATLPSAAANTGVQVYVTDGAAGLPIMAFSDGTNWLRCDTRAAVSAS